MAKSMTSQMPPELRAVCSRWSREVEKLSRDEAGQIDMFRNELPALLLKKTFFSVVLKKISSGHPYPDIRLASLFENEILLYLDPRRLFSLRMYLYGPQEHSPVHDHNSWGIIGHTSGKLEILTFKRLDDGSRDGFAQLAKPKRVTLSPGETAFTPPLNHGIHATGNPGSDAIAMISIYGRSIRRLYINGFDPLHNRVYRMHPPKLKKKMLAARILESLE